MRARALCLSIGVLTLMAGVLITNHTNHNDESLAVSACENGVVNRTPGQSFTVEIAFRNTGITEGTWSVNAVFEGEKWVWAGMPQNITLKPDKSETLIWHGEVPENATVDSVARLVTYYDDSYKALNWWIHVVPVAELAITSSTVK